MWHAGTLALSGRLRVMPPFTLLPEPGLMPLPILYRRLFPSLLLGLLLAVPDLQAHEGHEHADPEPQVLAAANADSGAGRATAQSESFELVAVPREQELLIYVDRFVDNSPFVGAQVEVESGSWRAQATEIEPGTYRVTVPLLAIPGRHGLLFTLSRGQEADLLETTLTVAAPTSPSLAPALAYRPLLWPVGLGLAGLLLFILWRQRRPGSERGSDK